MFSAFSDLNFYFLRSKTFFFVVILNFKFKFPFADIIKIFKTGIINLYSKFRDFPVYASLTANGLEMCNVFCSSSPNQHVEFLWVNVCKDQLSFGFRFDIEYEKFIVQIEDRRPIC